MVYVSKSESDTRELGRKIGESCSGGEIILLSGELGAGKTVFAKGVAQGLGVADSVVSPTFTLMNSYEGRLTLYHYDAYRLRNGAEAYEAGLCEYFGDKEGVCVIEWAQNIIDALASYAVMKVNITYNSDGTRTVEIVDK